MAQESVVEIIHNYLQAVNQVGIHARQAVLYGSWAKNQARADSDIDLVVIAPEFDGQRDHNLVDKLWELRVFTDWRIEPIACGVRQWREDDGSPIIAVARQEGEMIEFTPATA